MNDPTKNSNITTLEEAQSYSALGDKVRKLQNTLPKGTNDIPLSYIDPQALAEKGFVEGTSPKNIDNLVVKLEFLEGYPTVHGLPFWERLDGELLEHYKIFQTYRDMGLTGKRSLTETAQRSELPPRQVFALSKIYHWSERVKAFDIYQEKKFEAERQYRIRKMENRHAKAAESLFDICASWLEDEKNTENMTPKEVKELLISAAKLERLSLGMPTEKPLEESDRNNINTIITQINQNNDNRKMSLNVDKLQDVMDVLYATGQLSRVTEGNNGGKNNSGGNGSGEPNGSEQCIDATND